MVMIERCIAVCSGRADPTGPFVAGHSACRGQWFWEALSVCGMRRGFRFSSRLADEPLALYFAGVQWRLPSCVLHLIGHAILSSSSFSCGANPSASASPDPTLSD